MKQLIVLTALITLLLSSCDVIQIIPTLGTPSRGSIDTLAALTLSAEATQGKLSATEAAPAANVNIPPTSTKLAYPSRTPIPSRTPLPPLTDVANTTLLPTNTIDPDIPCNAAEFIRDVTIPDEMEVDPGESFTKIWELKNVGHCTWTFEYLLVLIWGNPMGTNPPLSIRRVVPPGEHVELSVNMVAPVIPVCWRGTWMLQSPDGEQFGTAFMYREPIWVTICVQFPNIQIPRRFFR